jgi:hypothetical protein
MGLPSAGYRPRAPEQDVLHTVVRTHREAFPSEVSRPVVEKYMSAVGELRPSANGLVRTPGRVYIHDVWRNLSAAETQPVAGFPRFASPVAREQREYFRALQRWFQTGTGGPTARPDDPLQPYRDGKPRRRRKAIFLRVDEYLLALTQEVARQHGLRYQAVMRLWIEEGLRRALVEGRDDPEPSPVVPRA